MSDTNITVKIVNISSVKKKIDFNIPWTDVKNELDAVYQKIGKTAKIKGFRQGKTPKNILERYYREQAEEDTLSNLVNRYYWETLQKEEIQAVAHPEIEQQGIELEKDFSFSATVEIEPVIEPKDYLGLELRKHVVTVTDEDVEARLNEISQMFATMEDLQDNRGVVSGDFVNLDYSGSVGNEMLKELAAEDYLLEIGSNSLIPGFEDNLIGMHKGESRTIDLQFPENYHATNLAGKSVQFKVNVKEIRTKKVPKIDAEFIKNFDKYESIDDLRDDVRKGLLEEKERKSSADFNRHIDEKLLEANDFEVPQTFVERQIYYMMSDAQRRLVANGMDHKKAAEFSMKLHDQLKDEASRIVKTVLLIKHIARIENISVTESELEDRIQKIAVQRAQDFETIKKSLEKEDVIENIKSDILSCKTYDYLAAKAAVTSCIEDKKA